MGFVQIRNEFDIDPIFDRFENETSQNSTHMNLALIYLKTYAKRLDWLKNMLLVKTVQLLSEFEDVDFFLLPSFLQV